MLRNYSEHPKKETLFNGNLEAKVNHEQIDVRPQGCSKEVTSQSTNKLNSSPGDLCVLLYLEYDQMHSMNDFNMIFGSYFDG